MKMLSIKKYIAAIIAATVCTLSVGQTPIDLIMTATAAETQETVKNGKCGKELSWMLDDEGTLIIYGEGKMEDWLFINQKPTTPWNAYLDDIKKVEIKNGVTTIGNHAFYNCKSLSNITIAKTVTNIGEKAFVNCESLVNVTIPEKVSSIGTGAFMFCNKLESVTIPDGITCITGSLFSNCSSLTSIVIPDNVTSLEGAAFFWLRKT